MEKIDVKDIKIERLNEKHNISNFQSYEKELVDFLVEDALENQKNRISVTYLIFLESGELVGYVTLLNDRINLEGDLNNRIPLIWDEWSTVESVCSRTAGSGILSVKNHLMCRYTQHATRLRRVVFD